MSSLQDRRTIGFAVGPISAGNGFRSASLRFAKATALEFFVPVPPETASSLAMALIVSSEAPLVLLDDGLKVIAASDSFRRCFEVQADPVGLRLEDLGAGEWNVPQLNTLLRATISGIAAIDAYEMDLVRKDHKPRRLVLRAHKLDYDEPSNIRIVLSVADVTEARLAEKLKDDLVREKQILLQELQHRVANSLQIIASVLMQSARQVQSHETRAHLRDAHHRVMSVATLQRQLAASRLGDVELRSYFADLCQSIGASMIRDHKHLSLTTRVDDSAVAADVSVSLGLIVTELVINALKHAFAGHDPAGKIVVDYSRQGGDWTLSVRDNGAGMPADQANAKPGLGTGIVEALAKQLDASVTVTDADPGTTVSIAHAE
jgi:two-component system, sensor histidine kinase PdtaS